MIVQSIVPFVATDRRCEQVWSESNACTFERMNPSLVAKIADDLLKAGINLDNFLYHTPPRRKITFLATD